jgi:hypothetical protein
MMDINTKRKLFTFYYRSEAWLAPSEIIELTEPYVAIKERLDRLDLDNMSMEQNCKFCIDVSMLLRPPSNPSEFYRVLEIEFNEFKERCKIMGLNLHRELAIAFTRLLFQKYPESLSYSLY